MRKAAYVVVLCVVWSALFAWTAGTAWSAGTYDGEWTGTTNQGFDMSFTVVDDRVTEFTIKLQVHGTVCTATQTGTVQHIPGDPIIDSAFTFASAVNQFEYRGEFQDGQTCTGTWEKTSDTCQGTETGTWSASRSTGGYTPKNGVWQSSGGGLILNLYLQKYATGSCILVVTVGDGMYTVFLDTNYSDGIHVDMDFDQRGCFLDLDLDSDSAGTVTVSLPGFGTVTKSVSLLYADTP